ncbi:TrkH family potassium uptake protein [Desulforudis sp. 1088]|uniref:TrkH family potassium uptake protein n=1 Tax=unclassified Candidatus Desulforudis TaxID=2635950 RepID=UPI003CE4BE3D
MTEGLPAKKPRIFTLTPPQVLVLGFALAILAGTLLLSLPLAVRDGKPDLLTAAFTATSAVCVTGLVVVDTADHWTLFGQLVILLLIHTGGLGLMTMGTLFALLLGRRIGLRRRQQIKESVNQNELTGIIWLVQRILLFTATAEAIGAAILTLHLAPEYGWTQGLWLGVFHSVSAFNNAGFDLFGGFRSLTGFGNDPVVSLTVAGLLILGGIGFSVAVDVYRKRSFRKLSLHSKIVIAVTILLLTLATVAVLLLEHDHALRDLTPRHKLLAAFFQASTPRTAGFNTVPLDDFFVPTQFLMMILMFIGASPGSTGGGIKTTTFITVGLALLSLARGREDAEVFGRRIPRSQVYKALAILVLGLTVVLATTLFLTITENGKDFFTIFFETVSAFGTVGLSLGLTPDLSPAGRLAVMFTMFIGRVGPLTLAFSLAQREHKAKIRLPEQKILIG